MKTEAVLASVFTAFLLIMAATTTAQAAQCPLLTAPANGAKEGSNYYRDVVSFTCDVGYELGGEASTTCQADGTWSVADPPTCTGKSGLPANGAITSTGNNLYGDEVSFRCDSGYESVGETNIICQADGTWTNAATCTAVECPLPTLPDNIGMTGSNYYLNELHFFCYPGIYREVYTIDSSKTSVRCEADGTWNDPYYIPSSDSDCQARECYDEPWVPLHGSRIGSDPFLYQDVVHFTCDPGYELVGEPSAECQADGEWTSIEPTCRAVQCAVPRPPQNGDVYVDQAPTYNSEARFWCDPGFTLGGESTITCQADGTWSGDAPVCTAVQCPQPTSPDNGDMSGSYSYPEEVTFTCNAGYQLVGAQTVTCRHDRTWSDSFPTCTDINGCSPNPCHPKATCEDVTAPGTGATCTCENGFMGDGVIDGTGCTVQLPLTFTEVALDHVTMSWTVPDDLTIMRYHVRYEHAGGFYEDLSPPPAPDNTTVTVSGLWADTEYTFTVTSFGEGGEENGRGSGTKTTAKVVVNVECSQGTMKVSIPLAGLPNVNVNDMHLLDSKCKATVGPTYVSLETGLKDCGTIEQVRANMENDKFIFMNEAIADPVTLANGAVRGTSFRRRFQCEFHRQFVISQGREVMYNIPSPSVEIVDADDVLTFNLNMFTSEDFSTMYDSSDFPLRMTPSDRLHFGLSLDSSLNVLELFALHCAATPTTDPNSDPKVSIIQDGCLVDPTLLMDSTRSNDMAMYFSVDAFTIPNADDSRLVYFHCTMLVCLKDDPDSRCNGGCVPSSRRKRALTDSREIRVRRESISERKANISQGPIIVEETQEAGTAFPTIGVAMGTVGGFLGVLLLVAALGRGRKKRHQNIEEMAGRRIDLDTNSFLSWSQMHRWGPRPQ
ncbi:PREDICTED: CUB and sushi domain-containing protein 1-like [Branchiostoma belcheri]|uniref:CUB and sushi domain-containing protein 1-like n=1 Tax=Branchiostoma belcheri TaxID=7741 RepID=A0A6P4YKC6_BRABE|nr:PREDICTED: CUB and sushi domain-containing protein 1-like [Branchiostoma belcheri]